MTVSLKIKHSRTFKDRVRHCAHVLKAQRRVVHVWKLEELKLLYVPVPKVASSGIRQMIRARQAELLLAEGAPGTRLYSCYRDKIVNAANRRRRCTLSPYGFYFGMSFEEFIERVAQIPDKYSDQHFRSQSALLSTRGELLVDYWGKLEQFAEDWEVLSTKFALSAPTKGKRVSGPAKSVDELPLTRRGVEMIMKRFQKDLDLFEYRQDVEALLERCDS